MVFLNIQYKNLWLDLHEITFHNSNLFVYRIAIGPFKYAYQYNRKGLQKLWRNNVNFRPSISN